VPKSTFRVKSLMEPCEITLDASGSARIVFVAHNRSEQTVTGFAEIVPERGASEDWFRIRQGRRRRFRGKEVQHFQVDIVVPPDTPNGEYGFRLIAAHEENPESDFAVGDSVLLRWNPTHSRRFDRLVSLALAALALVGLVVIASVGYLMANRITSEREMVRTANQAADSGEWDDYWDCWTAEGQDDLLVQTTSALRALAANSANSADSPELAAWMLSYGVRPEDVPSMEGQRVAGDKAVKETARAFRERLRELGRSERSFFVGAARWLEGTSKQESADSQRLAKFRASRRIDLTQELQLDADLAKSVSVWEGRPSQADAERGVLRVVFHKSGNRWLLHDVFPEEVMRRTVWLRIAAPALKPASNNDGQAPTAAPAASLSTSVVRLETTRRPVGDAGQSPYEDSALIYLGNSSASEPARLEFKPASDAVGDPNSERFLLHRSDRSVNPMRIASPLLFITDHEGAGESVFREEDARLTAAYFLLRPAKDVAPILKINPFSQQTVISYASMVYELPSSADMAEMPWEKGYIVGIRRASTPKAVSRPVNNEGPMTPDKNAKSDSAPSELLDASHELSFRDQNSHEKAPASGEYLIFEVEDKNPLESRIMGLDQELKRIAELAVQPVPVLDSSTPPIQSLDADQTPRDSRASSTTPVDIESALRSRLNRRGLDYFIDYSYGEEEGWLRLRWVFDNGRMRLRVTLNRFGIELSPTESTEFWEAETLAFRRSANPWRLVLGDNRGNILLESDLQVDVANNTWRWEGVRQGVGRLQTSIETNLGNSPLAGVGEKIKLARAPIDWSGTSTVMPYNKLEFELTDERSASERAFGNVASSFDNRWLAGVDAQGNLKVWRRRDSAGWKLMQELWLGGYLKTIMPQAEVRIRGVAISNDGQRIATAVTVVFDGKPVPPVTAPETERPSVGLVLVMRRQAEFMHYVLQPPLTVRDTAPLCVAFSRDGESNYLAAGLASGAIQVWRLRDTTFQEGPLSSVSSSPVVCLAFGPPPNTHWLAAGTADGLVRLVRRGQEANPPAANSPWTINERLRSRVRGGSPVHSVAFSPRGALLAGVTPSGVRVWQLNELQMETQN
jgi:WD40 repeat protein